MRVIHEDGRIGTTSGIEACERIYQQTGEVM